MTRQTKTLISKTVKWTVIVAILTFYGFIFAFSFGCVPKGQSVGWTSVQAAKLLEQSADDAIRTTVSRKMGECARQHGSFEGDAYEKCMRDVWKLQKSWETWAEPALSSAIVAATAALSVKPESDDWKQYVRKGVCVVCRLFRQWKHIIPYSEMVAPLLKALEGVTCNKERDGNAKTQSYNVLSGKVQRG